MKPHSSAMLVTEEQVQVSKKVFTKLKPSATGNSRNVSNRGAVETPVNLNRSETDRYREWIGNNSPFSFFITLTFGKFLGGDSRIKYTNELLHRINNSIFRRTYKKRNMFWKGFAFLENHKSSTLKDRYHIHMLIQHDIRYDELGFARINDIFYTEASGIKYEGTLVFNGNCIDIQNVKEDDEDQWRVIDYCLKHIWDKNLYRIKPICIDGLSDNHLFT